MESFEFCKVCKYLDIEDYACVRICSDMPGKTQDACVRRARELKVAKEFEFSEEVGEVKEQLKIFQKILRKFVNFLPAVDKVFPIIQEYTLTRILGIPKNHYRTFSEDAKVKTRVQDHYIQRQVNAKLTAIYKFPLQDDNFFTSSPDFVSKKIEKIEIRQTKLFQELQVKFGLIKG